MLLRRCQELLLLLVLLLQKQQRGPSPSLLMLPGLDQTDRSFSL
jgi:hypothetical protein